MAARVMLNRVERENNGKRTGGQKENKKKRYAKTMIYKKKVYSRDSVER